MPKVIQPLYSIQYDGTNGAYIAGTWCTGITLVSDTGTVLTYVMYDGNRSMNLGEWMVVWGPESNDPMIFTEAEYASRYYELP